MLILKKPMVPQITIASNSTKFLFNKTKVTSVKLVLFKYVMSFEPLTKVDRLTEIIRFGQVFRQRIVTNQKCIRQRPDQD